jgi:hypothetical protein
MRYIAFNIDGMYVSAFVGCLDWIPGAVMLMCIDFRQIAQACRLTNILQPCIHNPKLSEHEDPNLIVRHISSCIRYIDGDML